MPQDDQDHPTRLDAILLEHCRVALRPAQQSPVTDLRLLSTLDKVAENILASPGCVCFQRSQDRFHASPV
jgi:hypothetical protein